MNKRTFVKYLVKTIVMSAAGKAITRSLVSAVPATERYNIAEITGAVGGWYISEKLEPQTDELVDKFFDKCEDKKIAS